MIRFFKLISIIPFLFGFFVNCTSDIQPIGKDWEYFSDNAGIINDVAYTMAGDVVVTGFRPVQSSNKSYLIQTDTYGDITGERFVWKFDTKGNKILDTNWQQTVFMPVAYMTTDSNDNIFVLTEFKGDLLIPPDIRISEFKDFNNYALIMLTHDGNIKLIDYWKGYAPKEFGFVPFLSVHVDMMDNIYATSSVGRIRKYYELGNLAWEKVLNYDILDSTLDKDGNFYVIGSSYYFDTANNYTLDLKGTNDRFICSFNPNGNMSVIKRWNSNVNILPKLLYTECGIKVIDGIKIIGTEGEKFTQELLNAASLEISNLNETTIIYYISSMQNNGSINNVSILDYDSILLYDVFVDSEGCIYIGGLIKQEHNDNPAVDHVSKMDLIWIVDKFTNNMTLLDRLELGASSEWLIPVDLNFAVNNYGQVSVGGSNHGNILQTNLPQGGLTISNNRVFVIQRNLRPLRNAVY